MLVAENWRSKMDAIVDLRVPCKSFETVISVSFFRIEGLGF